LKNILLIFTLSLEVINVLSFDEEQYTDKPERENEERENEERENEERENMDDWLFFEPIFSVLKIILIMSVWQYLN
jgi:hypothetical protein